MSTKAQRDARDLAIAKLREIFPVGSTVSTLVTHVTSSGMTRDIAVLAPASVVYPDNTADDARTEVVDVSYLVARALGWKLSPLRYGRGVRVNGAGMDMAFHLVYSLARVLHADNTPDAAIRGDAGYTLTKRSI